MKSIHEENNWPLSSSILWQIKNSDQQKLSLIT